jgi:hypothetical protein
MLDNFAPLRIGAKLDGKRQISAELTRFHARDSLRFAKRKRAQEVQRAVP